MLAEHSPAMDDCKTRRSSRYACSGRRARSSEEQTIDKGGMVSDHWAGFGTIADVPTTTDRLNESPDVEAPHAMFSSCTEP